MTDLQDLADQFIVSLAREMSDEDRVFVGANQLEVSLAAMLARQLWAPHLKLWASGSILMNPNRDRETIGRRGYDPILVASRGATFWQARAFDDALRAPVVFAGGLQADSRGNANLVGVPLDEGGWRLRGPGSAGLPSLTAYADRFYLMVPSHTPRTLVERCPRISVLGDPAARAALGLNPDALIAVITPLARFVPTPDGLDLVERAASVEVDQIAEKTGFPIRTAPSGVAIRRPLSDDERRLLKELRDAAEENREAG